MKKRMPVDNAGLWQWARLAESCDTERSRTLGGASGDLKCGLLQTEPLAGAAESLNAAV